MCGACCQDEDIVVTLTAFDITQLSQGLRLDTNGLLRAIDFYVLPEGREAPEGLKDFPRIDTEQGPAYIALKKQPNAECIFLDDALCMIHKIRPLACRAFPFYFSIKDGSLQWGLSAKNDICPGLGKGPEVSHEELKRLGTEITTVLSNHHAVVKRWNESEKNPTAAGFIDSILALMYARSSKT
jgi:Fe-S-cluster containining protein